MAAAEYNGAFQGYWRDRRVHLLGHTGFTGAWLALWLEQLGAVLRGYSLPSPTVPALHSLLQPDYPELLADVTDTRTLAQELTLHKTQTLVYLVAAAEPELWLRNPGQAMAEEIQAAAGMLEAVRQCPGVDEVLLLTRASVYGYTGLPWPARETDPTAGNTPADAASLAIEQLARLYAHRYLNHSAPGTLPRRCRITLLRVPPLAGGGQWQPGTLMADALSAAASQKALHIPVDLLRPQPLHVLDAASAILCAAPRRWDSPCSVLNITQTPGLLPAETELAAGLAQAWPGLQPRLGSADGVPGCPVDNSLALAAAGWRPVWRADQALAVAAGWMKDFAARSYGSVYARCVQDLNSYLHQANELQLPWLKTRNLSFQPSY